MVSRRQFLTLLTVAPIVLALRSRSRQKGAFQKRAFQRNTFQMR